MLRQLRRHLAEAPLLTGRWWSRLAAVALAVGLLAAPGTAYASYQGRAYLPGDYFRGLHISGLGPHEMYAYYWPQNWVKNAGWVSDGFGDWIEAGQFVGTNKIGGCDASVAETVVAWWADWRPGSKYYCHVGGAMIEGANYGVTILQLSRHGTTWNVGSGGLAGRSTNSLSSANMIETGTTETSQASTSCSYSVALQWYDGNENLHYGWHDSSHGNARIFES
jgi:hypothetical protein